MSVLALAAAGGSEKDSPHKILVADDERHILRLLQVNLERAGYQVILAAHGLEALTKIAQEKPDVVLLDAEMPAPNGYEIMRQIRKQPETAHILVGILWAKHADGDVNQEYDEGADFYLSKPFNPAGLLALLLDL